MEKTEQFINLEAAKAFAEVAGLALERMIRRFEIADEVVAERGYPTTGAERFAMERELRRRIAEDEPATP